MADFLYHPAVALDPISGQLATNAVGQIYAVGDSATPITVRDLNGMEKSSVAVGEFGLTESFIATDLPEAVWRSGPYAVPLAAFRSMVENTQAAASAAQTAANAAEAAAEAAAGASAPTWANIQNKPLTFPPVIGTGPDQAFPGNGNFDTRYYTRAAADAKFALIGSTGGGDATLEGIPSLIRVEVGGVYPPRGTARADLQIVWIGTAPPTSATVGSGADFVNEPIALSRGTGQGPDRFEAVS